MPEETPPTPEPTPTPESTDDLGDAGQKAIAAERTARKAAEKAQRDATTRLADLEKRLADVDEATKSETEKALEKARKEAGDTARSEERAKSNRRILTAEVRAAAGGKLADPADAVRLLDLDEFTVDDDGDIDEKAISKAIDDLLKSKPYLAANGRKAPVPSADGGARTTAAPKTDDTPRGLIAAGLVANEASRRR